MKFGLAFELSVPRPFTGTIERDVYMRSLEQARLGDQLGFEPAGRGTIRLPVSKIDVPT